MRHGFSMSCSRSQQRWRYCVVVCSGGNKRVHYIILWDTQRERVRVLFVASIVRHCEIWLSYLMKWFNLHSLVFVVCGRAREFEIQLCIKYRMPYSSKYNNNKKYYCVQMMCCVVVFVFKRSIDYVLYAFAPLKPPTHHKPRKSPSNAMQCSANNLYTQQQQALAIADLSCVVNQI